ncbi:MAG: hypothetical protein LBV41_01090 [Cytophagaceae bacterium]|jgi:hypothetical protein|nr:hypothetical protein [Cytophagaceae bacterium]
MISFALLFFAKNKDDKITTVAQLDGRKYDDGTFYQIHETIQEQTLTGCEVKLEEIFS